MNLKMVSASAGSGKTTHLSRSIAEAVRQDVAPERIMATTFTRQAAQELAHRVRQKLIAEGMVREAEAVYAGLIGTINSTVGELLTELCWEAGLSPHMDVIDPSDGAMLMAAALAENAELATPAYSAAMERMNLTAQEGRIVKNIVDAVRANAISPSALRDHARRSKETLLQYFPLPLSKDEAQSLEEALRGAIGVVIRATKERTVTKKGEELVSLLQTVQSRWRMRGYLEWDTWVKLSKADLGAKNRDLAELLSQPSRAVMQHPQLRADIETVIDGVFGLAERTLESYRRMKQERGLVDFVDQEALTYDLLQQDAVKSRVRNRVQALWVDEFQDSSPLELALLQKLAELAERTTWVGDPKQSIYGFRGTDPELMNWAARELAKDRYEILDTSYRSREPLVSLVNDIFQNVFWAQSIGPERVILKAHESSVLEMVPPLELWHLEAKSWEVETQAIAAGVRGLLDNPDTHPVRAKDGGTRPLQGGDIAILCKTNGQCREVATALNAQGIGASVGRIGLLDTPEVGYALAALRYLWSKDDTLALAELVHLGQSDGMAPGRWLDEWLKEPNNFIGRSDSRIRAIEMGRQDASQLTVLEALDRALVASDAYSLVRGWSEPDVRQGNLEQLRVLAAQFQERATGHLRLAPTIGEFLSFLEDIQATGDDEMDSQARSHDADAVNVLTYHKAKGLEWPLVMMTFTDPTEASPFAVEVMSPRTRSVSRPLDGRWVRYWPWPFGLQRKGVALDVEEDIQRVGRMNEAERVRLAYVAMTRARDYLVWACRQGKMPKLFASLVDAEGVEAIGWPSYGEPVRTGGRNHPTVHQTIGPSDITEPTEVRVGPDKVWVLERPDDPPARRLPRRVSPSHLSSEMLGDILQTVSLGARIAIPGNLAMESVGDMVHGFYAATAHYPQGQWRDLARRMIERWGMSGIVPESLIEGVKRFREAMSLQYPGYIEQVEWPAIRQANKQVMTGWMDSLWAGSNGYVIVDHKTFPGAEDERIQRARNHAPQLAAYRSLLESAGLTPVIDLWIHFPIVGEMVRVSVPGVNEMETQLLYGPGI